MAERQPPNYQPKIDVVELSMAEDTDGQEEVQPKPEPRISRRQLGKMAAAAVASKWKFLRWPDENTSKPETQGKPDSKEQKVSYEYPPLDYDAYHLPKAVLETADGKKGAQDYYESIIKNEDVRQTVDALLLAQHKVINKIPEVDPKFVNKLNHFSVFLPIAYSWDENTEWLYVAKDVPSRPSELETNYANDRSQWSVSTLKPIYDIGSQGTHKLLQIGGAQMSDMLKRSPSPKTWFKALHGGNAEKVFNEVIKKSKNHPIPEWDYTNVEYKGILPQFLTQDTRIVRPELHVNINDIAETKLQFNTNPRLNFFTQLAVKTPEMNFAMLYPAVSGWGKNQLHNVKHDIANEPGGITPEKAQKMANIMEALYRRYQDLRNEGTLDGSVDPLIPMNGHITRKVERKNRADNLLDQ